MFAGGHGVHNRLFAGGHYQVVRYVRCLLCLEVEGRTVPFSVGLRTVYPDYREFGGLCQKGKECRRVCVYRCGRSPIESKI